MAEEKDRLQERDQLELVQRQDRLTMSVDVSEILNQFDAGGSEVSTSNTGEDSAEASIGTDAGNDTDSGRRIILQSVTRCYGEKYRTNSKNMTFSDTKYFLTERL